MQTATHAITDSLSGSSRGSFPKQNPSSTQGVKRELDEDEDDNMNPRVLNGQPYDDSMMSHQPITAVSPTRHSTGSTTLFRHRGPTGYANGYEYGGVQLGANGSTQFSDYNETTRMGRMGQQSQRGFNMLSPRGSNTGSGLSTEPEENMSEHTMNGTKKRQSKKQRSQLTPVELEEASRKLREKNAQAAQRCRERKKLDLAHLEHTVIRYRRENTYLLARNQESLDEVLRLRGLLNRHEQCNHPDFREYFAPQRASFQQLRGAFLYRHAPPPISYQSHNLAMGYAPQGYPSPNPTQFHPQFYAQNGFTPRQSAAPLNVQPHPQQPNRFNGFESQATTLNTTIPSPDSGIIMDCDSNTSNQMRNDRTADGPFFTTSQWSELSSRFAAPSSQVRQQQTIKGQGISHSSNSDTGSTMLATNGMPDKVTGGKEVSGKNGDMGDFASYLMFEQ